MTPATLSPSQVICYLDCAWRWYCSSVLRLPEPVSHSLAIGRAVHTAAAILLTGKAAGETATPEAIEDAITAACDLQTGAESQYGLTIAPPRSQDQADEQETDRRADEAQVTDLVSLWWTAAAPSIQPARIESQVSGSIAGIPVTGIIDIVDESGTLIDIKTASKRPSGISPAHRLQMITYAMLDQPAAESHTVRLDYLTKSRTPAYVQLKTGLAEEDYRYAEAIYPMTAEAMAAGIYLPNRSSNLCSRKHCAHWQACEAEYGGTVRP